LHIDIYFSRFCGFDLNTKMGKMRKALTESQKRENIKKREIHLIKMRLQEKQQFLEKIVLTAHVEQVDKKQDFATVGQIDDCCYGVSADGHGGSSTIVKIRSLDWATILKSENIVESIFEEIKSLGNTTNDGATLTIFKIFSTHIDVYWAGDSSARVYKNGIEIFRTKDHDFYNEEEMEIIGEKGISHYHTWRLCVKNPSTVTQLPARYFKFGPGHTNTLNMTRSFGHNGITGCYMSHARIPIEKSADSTITDTYKVITGSDGFWDMICPEDDSLLVNTDINAKDLTMFAVERWTKKDWLYVRDEFPGYPALSNKDVSLGKGDDVSVAVAQFSL
jgi:serine/threonine protein phosphatase PrpC